MIVVSIFCTLRIIVSLFDQISRNPIVIYREDTPIDVTKVSGCVHNWKKHENISIKIPFPAFTVCEIDNATYRDSSLNSFWFSNLHVPVFVMLLELGMCRTVNFCYEENFFEDQVDQRRIFQYYQVPQSFLQQNLTQPIKTPSPELGIDSTIENNDFYRFFRTRGNSSYTLMIHSPFELPTKRNQKFVIADMDFDTFFVTPQLNTVDDSMIGMDLQE